MALLVLDVGDDDGSCAVSSELVAHAACASGDNGNRQTDLKLKGKERTEGIGGWEEREPVRENRGEREEKRIKWREKREKREKKMIKTYTILIPYRCKFAMVL